MIYVILSKSTWKQCKLCETTKENERKMYLEKEEVKGEENEEKVGKKQEEKRGKREKKG